MLNTQKIFLKFKICDMPKMTQNGPKWALIYIYDIYSHISVAEAQKRKIGET